jgi:hypothetical protein
MVKQLGSSLEGSALGIRVERMLTDGRTCSDRCANV